MNTDLEFQFLSQDHKDEIVQLRHNEYRKYYQEKVDVAGLNWNNADRTSIHLGIRNIKTQNLIAYLRLTGFQSKEKLELTTLFETPAKIQLPVALLTRAATNSGYESRGLHNILRCRALEICLERKMMTLLGTLETSSKRFDSLMKMGYEALASKENWGNQSYIQSNQGVTLIALVGEARFRNAIDYYQAKYALLPLDKKTIPDLEFI